MFTKLLTNVSINPSLMNQFSFYANRLKKEQSIRKLGLFFIVMSMLVQLVASMFPAERSLAASINNDIITGGVTSKADLVNKCNANTQIQAIYAKFGVSCAEIAATTTQLTTINSSGNYWSMGRTPLAANGIDSDAWGERTLHAGGTTIYHRPLKAWGAGVNYQAFSVKSGSKTYWILKNCGNLTTLGPEGPTPDLEVHKQLMTPAIVKPGDLVKFRLTYRNIVSESVAIDFRLRDLLDNTNLDYVSMSGGTVTFISSDPKIELKGLGFSPTLRESIVTAKVKTTAINGTKICNIANASADVVGIKPSNQVCFTVSVPPPPVVVPPVTTQKCQFDASLNANDPKCPRCTLPGLGSISTQDPKCVLPAAGNCIVSTSLKEGSNKDIVISTEASVEGNTKIESYSYDLDVDGKIDSTTKTTLLKDTKDFKNLSKGTHKIQVMVNFINGTQKISKTCVAEIDVAEDAKLVQSKEVTDDKGNNLDGKKISSGDIVKFKLTTKNVTATDSPSYSGEDFIGDVMEYADLVDSQELSKQGITLGNDKILRWTTSTIKGKSEEVKTVTFKVKPVIASTNKPVSTGTNQDCIISNKFGNQVSVNINCPLIKQLETATTQLPNTGPGTTIGLAFLVTVIAGYFFSRSRLMNKEAGIVRNMYQQAI